MASKRVSCSHCGMQILVPQNIHSFQCVACQTIIRLNPNDPLCQTHNSTSNATSKLKDLLNTASSNINMMVKKLNSYSTPNFGHYPQPAKPSASLIPVSAHGRNRAVLCGVSYQGQRYRLEGTVNDVKCMRYFLIQKLGFPTDSILVLTGTEVLKLPSVEIKSSIQILYQDQKNLMFSKTLSLDSQNTTFMAGSEKDSLTCYLIRYYNQHAEEGSDSLIPTKNNIRKALRWLVQGCQSGDSLVFHYSGHGSQQQDFDRDEVDGYDEMLWPVDHQTEGKILDDEINATIVRPLPRGAKLHSIIDACHSGTILDLPFVCRMNREGYYVWEDHGLQSAIYKGTNGGLAVSFSACEDHQISLDTTALSGNAATGAMTYSFIQVAQSEPGLTYGRLLNAMRHKIHQTNMRFLPDGPVGSAVRKVLGPKLQEPQLSSSEKFDIYSRQFVL